MQTQSSICSSLRAVLATVLLIGTANSSCATTTPVQSPESFKAAILNGSTSPSYVMITVFDLESEQSRPACLTANLLLNAIDRENRSSDKPVDRSTLTEIVLASPDHVFRFHRLVLATMPVNYSDDAISAARTLLAAYSSEELEERFSLVSRSRLNQRGYDRGAMACALIERGLSPKRADWSGQVYIGP